MKLNIKGLVFVGFAAAVFASAANAANDNDYKTVTSKTYVDTELANKVTKNADITPGTAAKITYDAKGLVTAGAALTATDIPALNYQAKSTVANQISDGAGAWKSLDATIDSTTASSTAAPTTAAVKTYVDAQVSGVTSGAVYQAKSVAAEKQFVANGAGGWEALDTDAAPTANSTKPVESGGVATALGGKQDAALVTTLSNADDTHYPSAKTVADAISAQANTAGNTYQAKSGAAYNLGNAEGGWTAMTAGEQAALGSGITSAKVSAYDTHVTDTTVHITGAERTAWNAKEDASNKVTTISGQGSATEYPSTSAVVNYVGTQVGVTIPAPTGTACGTGTPCALVIENGVVSWEPIQQ